MAWWSKWGLALGVVNSLGLVFNAYEAYRLKQIHHHYWYVRVDSRISALEEYVARVTEAQQEGPRKRKRAPRPANVPSTK